MCLPKLRALRGGLREAWLGSLATLGGCICRSPSATVPSWDRVEGDFEAGPLRRLLASTGARIASPGPLHPESKGAPSRLRAASTSPSALPPSTRPSPWDFTPEHATGRRVSLPQHARPTPPDNPAPASSPGISPGDPAFSAREPAGTTHHTLKFTGHSTTSTLTLSCMVRSMLLAPLTTLSRRSVWLLSLLYSLPLILLSLLILGILSLQKVLASEVLSSYLSSLHL